MQQSKNFHYRYERKYINYDYSSAQLRNYLLLSSQTFQKIYHKRQVNSIYFDTPEFEYFQQNINGEQNRCKVRVRWYGQQILPERAQLEIKIKVGSIMRKEVLPLNCKSSSLVTFINNLTRLVRTHLKNQLEEASALQPVIINSYQREYFYSPVNQIRVTLDDKIEVQSIANLLNKRRPQAFEFNILECKYTLENDSALQAVVQTLPIQISKSSKYVMGIQQSYPNLVG